MIIEENYKNKSKENELNNNRDLNKKELEYKKKQYSNEEEVKKKYYENLINNLKKKLENDKLKLECELNQINGDIFNLKKEIDELNIKNKEELISLRKKVKEYRQIISQMKKQSGEKDSEYSFEEIIETQFKPQRTMKKMKRKI